MTTTWAVLFRPSQQLRAVDGKLQRALILKGVTAVRSEAGSLVFEGPGGTLVYAVPLDVVAFAGDIAYEASLTAAALRDIIVQGQA